MRFGFLPCPCAQLLAVPFRWRKAWCLWTCFCLAGGAKYKSAASVHARKSWCFAKNMHQTREGFRGLLSKGRLANQCEYVSPKFQIKILTVFPWPKEHLVGCSSRMKRGMQHGKWNKKGKSKAILDEREYSRMFFWIMLVYLYGCMKVGKLVCVERKKTASLIFSRYTKWGGFRE